MDLLASLSSQAAALEHKRASELEALQKITEKLQNIAERGISHGFTIRDDQGNCTVCTAEFGKFLDSLSDTWEMNVDSLTDCAFFWFDNKANGFCNKGGPRTEPPRVCRVEGTAGWLTGSVCLGLCRSSSRSGARRRGVSPTSHIGCLSSHLMLMFLYV